MKSVHLCLAISIPFLTSAGRVQADESWGQIQEPWGKTQKPWTFLESTTTHSGESPLSPGKGWLALIKGKSGWELVETTVKATRMPSDIADYDIKISGKHNNAIAFFRLPNVKAGRVSTPDILGGKLDASFYEKINGKYPFMKFSFGKELYQINVTELSTKREEDKGKFTIYKFGVLVVQNSNKSSRLGLVGDAPWDESVTIGWMGDIDGDGKLDLVTQYDGSNSGGLCLHLSGTSKGKKK